MPRKKRTPPPPPPEGAPIDEGMESAAPPPPEEPSGPQQERISIPLTPDGKIDFSAMREKTKERLASAISASGITSVSGVEEVTEAEMQAMFGLFAGLQAFYVSARYDVPAPEAAALCAYTPEQMQLLTGPAARVMTKYGGGLLGRYRDELGLMMALIYVEGVKLARIRAYLETQEKKRQQSAADARAQAQAGSGGVV